MTDFAAGNYYARHDGTEDYTGQEGDDLTPLVVALDRTEAAVAVPVAEPDPVRVAALAFRAVERTGDAQLDAQWQSEAWWSALYRLRDVCDLADRADRARVSRAGGAT